MFARQIDDWRPEHWTSTMRGGAGYPRFRGRERDFSDFTYVDTSGSMKAALRNAGIEPNAAWSNATKFHIEVNGTPDNAYILLRVFNLKDRRDAGVRFFPDPWRLYVDGVLNFKHQGYKVYH